MLSSLKKDYKNHLKDLNKHQRAFTLVELLVVVVVLGILITFAARAYTSAIQDAKLATLKKNLSTLREQLQAFASDKGYYPADLVELTQGTRPYLSEVPVDPMTNSRDWQVAPPRINIADRNFYEEAGYATTDWPKVTSTGFGPTYKTLDIAKNLIELQGIITSSDSDFLAWQVSTTGQASNVFTPNPNPKLKVTFRKNTSIIGVKVTFYSMPKIKYKVDKVVVGSDTVSGSWAVNDTFYLDLTEGRPKEGAFVEIEFSARYNSITPLPATLIGVRSIDVYEKCANINAAKTATVIDGNKWYSQPSWDKSIDGDDGLKCAANFGIGMVRSNKKGFSSL